MWRLAVGVFVVSWLFRFNDPGGSFAGLTDDHFFYVVRGWQILFGDLPVRDFVDHGAPLFYYVARRGAEAVRTGHVVGADVLHDGAVDWRGGDVLAGDARLGIDSGGLGGASFTSGWGRASTTIRRSSSTPPRFRCSGGLPIVPAPGRGSGSRS